MLLFLLPTSCLLPRSPSLDAERQELGLPSPAPGGQVGNGLPAHKEIPAGKCPCVQQLIWSGARPATLLWSQRQLGAAHLLSLPWAPPCARMWKPGLLGQREGRVPGPALVRTGERGQSDPPPGEGLGHLPPLAPPPVQATLQHHPSAD